ncbi:MAG: helix-turn-helix transcriptional regulator [Gammaproteobacteria bacterium]|nr:helix-turn-helix transcriptional regulator [Gammaproteobacteria bacterium]
MTYEAQRIAERLRAARQAKGLSQRELSSLAGMPQAQISRIEAGAVDLRLSSLVALAHALDLGLELVPRKVVPAVRALSRQAMDRHQNRLAASQQETQRIDEAASRPAYSLDEDDDDG